jgi:electron transfer flavoprotein alpha subunit
MGSGTMESIVVIAEHAADHIKPVTYELIAFGRKLQRLKSQTLEVIILGSEVTHLARKIADISGLDVTAIENPEAASYNGELYSKTLSVHLHDHLPAYVCVAHTSQGLDFAPSLAVKLNAACITGIEDVVELEGGPCFARPLYGGKITAHVRANSQTAILTVQAGIFHFKKDDAKTAGTVATKSVQYKLRQSRTLGIKQIESDTAGLTKARVIVAVGQGIGDKDNLDIIYKLASLFSKSAVAGSRIVCDLNWLAYRCQVGVTGATVSPRLYIACGISGAIQHVMGMRGSEFVVAINRDPTAAIFQVADVCVVEDLFKFVPTFIETCRKEKDNSGGEICQL